MKYKVGDKVIYLDSVWQIKSCGLLLKIPPINSYDLIDNFGGYFTGVAEDKLKPLQEGGILIFDKDVKILSTHEDTIINLNDLNTAKSRQIERLMKFIAKDYTITNDLDYDLIRETLLKDIRDEDLVNAIMYHVRKGK